MLCGFFSRNWVIEERGEKNTGKLSDKIFNTLKTQFLGNHHPWQAKHLYKVVSIGSAEMSEDIQRSGSFITFQIGGEWDELFKKTF